MTIGIAGKHLVSRFDRRIKMHIMKKCKIALSKTYGIIGEEGFQDISEWLIRLLCVSPIIAGIVNYIMLLDIPSYDPYVYNDRWIIISDIGFALMTATILLYILTKMSYNDFDLLQVVKMIKDKEPWLLFWIALLMWGIIPCLNSVSIRGAFLGATELYSGYITHVFMLCVMGCAFLLSHEGRKRVIYTYVAVSDMLVIIMLAFNYDIPFIRWFSAYAGDSTFTNSNHYGYYLAMAIPFLAAMYFIEYDKAEADLEVSKLPCIIYLISYVIHMQGMVINDCMGAFLGVFFSVIILIIFWAVRKRKLRFAYLVPLMLLVVIVYLSYVGIIYSIMGPTTGTSLSTLFRDIFKVAKKSEGYEAAGTNRIFLWKQAIKAIAERPILGYGPDIMYNKSEEAVVSMTPHNEFLECALYLGIPGLILYLGGLLSLFVSRLKRLKELPDYMIAAAAAVIGYQISAFFGVRKFHIVPYMFMFLGMLIVNNNNEKEGFKE